MEKNSPVFSFLSSLIFGTAYYYSVVLLSRNRPTIYVADFNAVSLTTTNTTTIYIDLKIQNENSGIGVYYDDPLNLTVTYFPPSISTDNNVTIGRTIQGFYQGNGKVKHIKTSVVVKLDLFLEAAAEQRRKLGENDVSFFGPAKVIDFMVGLEAKIKFKSIENKKSNLIVQSAVEVNANSGSSVIKTIEMKYASGSNKWGAGRWIMCILLVIFFCAGVPTLAVVGFLLAAKLAAKILAFFCLCSDNWLEI